MALQTLVDCTTLAAHLDDPDWRIFDCRFDLADTSRGAADYALGHVPGAHYAHLDHDLSSPITPTSGRHPLPAVPRLAAWLGRCGVASGRQVVAYDSSGGTMAVRLWWLLRWLGHTEVAVLNGGWQAWQGSGLPVDRQAPAAEPDTVFDARPDPGQVLTTAMLARALTDGDAPLLIDVRTRPRFRGEAEPIDPVAGHVPGAVNLPLQDHLDGDGMFKPADELRAMYQGLLGDRTPTGAALMCGSGVTACHGLLAMAIAGLPGARLYDGSWSEWIRDPQREMVCRGRRMRVGDF